MLRQSEGCPPQRRAPNSVVRETVSVAGLNSVAGLSEAGYSELTHYPKFAPSRVTVRPVYGPLTFMVTKSEDHPHP